MDLTFEKDLESSIKLQLITLEQELKKTPDLIDCVITIKNSTALIKFLGLFIKSELRKKVIVSIDVKDNNLVFILKKR